MDVCVSPCPRSSVPELQMQSQVLALEDGKKGVEAKMLQEHQELEAAVAKNHKLSDQIQAVTKSLEEKCRVAVSQADQKMTLLQVGLHLGDTSDLCLLVQHRSEHSHAQNLGVSSDTLLASRVRESHCQWCQLYV